MWSYTTTLSGDSTWGPAAGPIVVQTEYYDVNVQGTDGPDGVTTLTILPGVTVAFRGSTKRLRVGRRGAGALVADGGGPGGPAPIRFTSTSASPAPGDWNGLRFDGQTHPSTLLRNVVIEYAGTTGTVVGNEPAIGLNTESVVAVRLERVTIPNSAWAGIEVSRGTLDLRELSISNTGSYSIRIPGSNFGTVSGTVADSSLESVWYANELPRIAWTGNTFENWGARESRVAVGDAGVFSTEIPFTAFPGPNSASTGRRSRETPPGARRPAASVLENPTLDFQVQGTDGPDGVTTLTLLPGTVIALRGGTKVFRVGSGAPGALIADGDAAGGPAPIRFTSSSASPATGELVRPAFRRPDAPEHAAAQRRDRVRRDDRHGRGGAAGDRPEH